MDNIVLLGKHFGYPKCCVESFLKTEGAVMNPEGGKVSRGTGFIPCPKHAKQILNKEITLKSLIKNREHSLQFPKQNDEEILEFMRKDMLEVDIKVKCDFCDYEKTIVKEDLLDLMVSTCPECNNKLISFEDLKKTLQLTFSIDVINNNEIYL